MNFEHAGYYGSATSNGPILLTSHAGAFVRCQDVACLRAGWDEDQRWTPQVLVHRAAERDEAEIWPRMKHCPPSARRRAIHRKSRGWAPPSIPNRRPGAVGVDREP